MRMGIGLYASRQEEGDVCNVGMHGCKEAGSGEHCRQHRHMLRHCCLKLHPFFLPCIWLPLAV